MVAKMEEGEADLNAAGWAQPFDYTLWCMILGTIFFSGMVYWCLIRMKGKRNGSPNDDELEEQVGLVDATVSAAFNFTTQAEFEGSRLHMRFFAFSMSFLALVIITSYTANLTSFLVVERSRIYYNSLEEAVQQGARICVWRGSAGEEDLRSMYPTAKLVLRESTEELYDAVRAGDCDINIESIGDWDMNQRKRNLNPECNSEYSTCSMPYLDGGK
jgi:hypothetical protein